MGKIIDGIVDLIFRLRGTEGYLHRYQGYRSRTCILWKRQTDLSWKIAWKIINNLIIFDAPKIRNMITEIVDQNKEIFDDNCYVTAFGKPGKSGDVIMYDFNHCTQINQRSLKKVWELPKLPPYSKIVFVEDLIGTGTQSLTYITERLNLLLNPSHLPYLLTLCATPEAIRRVEDNTNFKVLPGLILNEKDYQHYSAASQYFSEREKNRIKELNSRLKDLNKFDYDRGLLIAFYYGVPNNTMPVIWKDGYAYTNHLGQEKKWLALLPRQF